MAGNRNRTAGHSWEREIAKVLREEVGYEDARCSRECSRLRDNQKVDICNADEDASGRLPYNIQAKCLSTISKYPKLLGELEEYNGRKQINVVFHKQTEKVAGSNRFMPRGKFACLNLDDFLKMMAKCRVLDDVIPDYLEYIPDEERIKLEEELKKLD